MDPAPRILIVEDDVNARTALAELLRDEGYRVDTAGYGAQAFALLDQLRPRLLVTELGARGRELLNRARVLAPPCAVVMMTVLGAAELAARPPPDGGIELLSKPVDLDRLRQAIERGLGHERTSACLIP